MQRQTPTIRKPSARGEKREEAHFALLQLPKLHFHLRAVGVGLEFVYGEQRQWSCGASESESASDQRSAISDQDAPATATLQSKIKQDQ